MPRKSSSVTVFMLTELNIIFSGISGAERTESDLGALKELTGRGFGAIFPVQQWFKQ